MRVLVLLLIVATFIAPMAWADPDHGPVWPLRVTETVVTPDDPVHAFPLLYPDSFQEAGDWMAISARNAGPADLTMRLKLGESILDEWPLPAGDPVAITTHALDQLGKFHVEFVNADPGRQAAVSFFFDAEALCDAADGPCIKRLPHELDGGLMLVPVDVASPGVYRTTVIHEDLHSLTFTVQGPEGAVLPTQATADEGLILVEWETETAGAHRLLVESSAVDRSVYDNAPDSVAAYDTQRIEVSPTGPYSRGIPAPTPLLVIAALALIGVGVARKEG